MKKALITGVTGQDGSYLAEFLLSKGYQVHGLVRRASTFNTERIDHINDENLILHHGDVSDPCNIHSIFNKVEFDEVYNLAGASHVAESFTSPLLTAQINALGTLNILDAIKEIQPKARMYQASTSELFGNSPAPQNEETPMMPQSPYACSKLYAYWCVKNYREAYNLHCSNGILFNHEGQRRLPTFVSRKITYGIAQVLKGKQDVITLGNLLSKRDWSLSDDVCEAMWLILQHPHPLDICIGSGETRTIKEFVEEAFRYINIDITWRGQGIDEEGFDPKTGKVWIKVHPKYFRPLEVNCLCADITKARQTLGWQPKTTFSELVKIMMKHDLMEAGVSI